MGLTTSSLSAYLYRAPWHDHTGLYCAHAARVLRMCYVCSVCMLRASYMLCVLRICCVRAYVLCECCVRASYEVCTRMCCVLSVCVLCARCVRAVFLCCMLCTCSSAVHPSSFIKHLLSPSFWARIYFCGTRNRTQNLRSAYPKLYS